MTQTKHIIPALIAKNQDELNDRLDKVKSYVDWVQLDVMDNIFVPNTSLFFDFQVPSDVSCKYEAHLMVSDPDSWIKNHGEKVDTILVHYESTQELLKTISIIKQKKKRAGVVLNPETPISVLFDMLDQIDQVLIMTVNPGFYGSPFLPEMMNKIIELRQMKPDLDIEVDGGVTDETIELVNKAGANLFVSGSYIIKAENIKQAMETLKSVI